MNPNEPEKPQENQEQPEATAVEQPTAIEQPSVPQEPHAPVQPVAPPAPVGAPQGAPIQYVQAPENHEGVAGWLVGWIVYLAFWAVSSVPAFFTLLVSSSGTNSYDTSGSSDTLRIISLIFLPLISAAALGAILTIAQRKKLGKTLSLAFIGVAGLYVIISVLVGVGASGAGESAIPLIAGYITAVAIVCPLQALYFFQSKRVKATLIK